MRTLNILDASRDSLWYTVSIQVHNSVAQSVETLY